MVNNLPRMVSTIVSTMHGRFLPDFGSFLEQISFFLQGSYGVHNDRTEKPKVPGKSLNQSFSYSFAITNPRKVLYLFCALNAVSYAAFCVLSAKAAFALVRAVLNLV